MAQRLLLVNPTPRKAQSKGRGKTTPKAAKRTKPMKARRSAAQKAATRKLIAFNRRRKRPAAKRKAPARRRGSISSRSTAPRRRRTRSRVRRNPATNATQRSTYARTAQMNPRRRRIQRNPARKLTMRTITNDLLMPAAVGAVGAIANDALFTYLPLPVQLKTPGIARYATKGVSAVLMTWAASFVVKQRTALQMGVGALTTLTAEIARNFMIRNVPALAPAAMEGLGMYTSNMGYYNPAPPAGGGAMGVYVPGPGGRQLPSLASRETPGVAPSMGMMSDEHGYSYS